MARLSPKENMSEVETSNFSTNVLERAAALTRRTFARHRS
jgi:hypothetical protein